MPTVIKELANYDRAKVERSVSDLLWFYDNQSEAILTARDFLFSASGDFSRTLVSHESYDSLEILWHILKSYDRSAQVGTGPGQAAPQENSGNERNRLVVIGGYGWGKSTLALVAAQFLGLPHAEPGRKAVVEALDPESSDAPRQLVDKADSKKPKFAVCIKGAGRNFHDLLIAAVSASKERYRTLLDKHGIKLNVKSEFDAAAEWIRNLADAPGFEPILTEEGLTTANLLSTLAELNPEGLHRADRIWQRHNRVDAGVRPAWYSQTDSARYLGELVEAVTAPPDSPFDGVLVLFDELGLWLAYANENETVAGGPAFLAFLEKARDLSGKLSICSFIQADIEVFVGRDTQSNNVRHISERLGARLKYCPDLERVFQAAIKQNREGRRELWDRHEADFEEFASQLVAFFDRYHKGTWSGPGKVKEVLVKRSWPIHPFMVAAVCHLRFGQGHRVIQILEDQFPRLNDRLIESDSGTLSWSVPTDVVDFYQSNFENLHVTDGERRIWDRFAHAKTSLRADDGNDRVKVLKAVFLSLALAGSLRAQGANEFVELISLFSGLTEDAARAALISLSSSHGAAPPQLLQNENTGWYEFFAIESNPAEARDYVRKKYEEKPYFDFSDAAPQFVQASLSPSNFAQNRHIQVHGYQKLFEQVIDVGALNVNYLINLAHNKVAVDVDPDFRGVHLIVLYSEDKKLSGLPSPDKALSERVHEYCQRTLSEAWRALVAKGESVPLMLSVPTETPSEVYRSLAMINCARYVPTDDQKRLGQGLSTFVEMEERRLERSIPAVSSPGRLALLLPDASVDQRMANVQATGNKQAIVASYFDAVFLSTPPLNSSTLGSSGTRFAKYLRSLVEFILNPQRQRNMPQEHANAIDSVLAASSGLPDRNWMVVEETTQGISIIAPKNVRAKTCFDALDAQIRSKPTGSKLTIGSLWQTFSKAPYGLDVRSFMLLFSVWYTTHRNECQLSFGGEAVGWETLVTACEKRSDLFSLVKSQDYSLRLRDTAAEAAAVRELLTKLKTWKPNTGGGQVLISAIDALRGTAPGLSEWNELETEYKRVRAGVQSEAQAVATLRSLHAEVLSHCKLDTLGDYARRLNAVVNQASRSNHVDDDAINCCDALLAVAERSVRAALAEQYASAEVEEYELRRVLRLLDSTALAEVARDIDSAAAARIQASVDLFTRELTESANSVESRHQGKKALEAQIAATRASLQRITSRTSVSGATLVDLAHTCAELEALANTSPQGVKAEVEDALRSFVRGHSELERRIRGTMSTFEADTSSRDISRRLEQVSECAKLAKGSPLEPSVGPFANAIPVITDAASHCQQALDSLGDGPNGAVAHSRALLALEQQSEALVAHLISSWRKQVEEAIDRKKSTGASKCALLRAALSTNSSPAHVLRVMEDIRAFEREFGAYCPGAGDELRSQANSLLAQSAPAQIANILKPIPRETHQSVVDRALRILEEG